MSSAELTRTVETSQNKAPAAERGNVGKRVSLAFPGQETGFSAYLCGIAPTVSLFPAFPGFSGGVSI
jgi:hypothetical protein